MQISTIIVIAGGILLIFWALLSKKEQTRQKKICKILIGVFFLIAGLVDCLIDTHPTSISFTRFLRTVSHVSFGIVLGIILTLRVFGEIKFTKKS
ncbi:MAG TPA: hypothetical protein VHG71_10910 [Verrucomicrobiae bacterium]|nr:hypothetical protein [Verrucomicrobiae bacterium]